MAAKGETLICAITKTFLGRAVVLSTPLDKYTGKYRYKHLSKENLLFCIELLQEITKEITEELKSRIEKERLN